MAKFLVNVAVTDLRKEPVPAQFTFERDLLQESQLLYNESVVGIEEKGDWIYVEAIEQQKYSADGGWRGYPGWVLRKHLVPVNEFPKNNFTVTDEWNVIYREPFLDSEIVSQVCMGTRLFILEQVGPWHILKLPDGSQGALKTSSQPDATLLITAKRMQGHPYFWGGKSFFNPLWKQQLSGCDCSGLVGLVYSVHGKQLPRDAQDQFLRCKPVDFVDMKVGDLIFLEDVQKPGRKSHVMLYAGGDAFFDTNITDKKAVAATATVRFGIPFANMKQNQNCGKYLISFGSLQGESDADQ